MRINQKKTKYKENKEKYLINTQNFYDGREMIINASKNEIFPLVPSGYTSNDDKGLRPDSPTPTLVLLISLISLMSLILLLMTLMKCKLVMLMNLMNCFLIQRNM